MSLNSTPRTWASSEVVTAAMMNVEVRDAFTGIQAAWTSYTPTWTGTTTNPVIGNGTISGRYMQVGKTIHYEVKITMGSTTTYGSGAYLFSLPVAARAANRPAGQMTALDASLPGVRTHHAYTNSTTVVATHNDAGTNSGPTAPFTWATSDTITVAGTYEAA